MQTSDFESFSEFSRKVYRELPSEWNTNFDELCLEKTDGRQAGYQRDDLYKWMLVVPHDEDWPVNKIFAYMPEEIDGIPDRPGVPTHTLEDPTVTEVVSFLKKTSLDYQGKFTYDE